MAVEKTENSRNIFTLNKMDLFKFSQKVLFIRILIKNTIIIFKKSPVYRTFLTIFFKMVPRTRIELVIDPYHGSVIPLN